MKDIKFYEVRFSLVEIPKIRYEFRRGKKVPYNSASANCAK